MRMFKLVWISLLLLVVFSCSNDDMIFQENQIRDLTNGDDNLILFEQSYNEWLSARAKLSMNGKTGEIPMTAELIIDQAYDFLLAFGYDEKQLKKELQTNEDIVIAEAIKLYINQK